MIEAEKDRAEDRVDSLEDEITALEREPEEWVRDRIDQLDDAIGRVEPRTEPVNDGNKTMYQHLQDLKRECEENEEKVIAERKAKLEARKEREEQRLADLED